MRSFRMMRHLPIVFRALDLESRTKPVPSVACPVRAELMTVGNCGRCTEFRRIEFADDGTPVLCCTSRCARQQREARVQNSVHVPVVCAAADTELAVILPYVGRATALDSIPVLDRDARPIGFLTVDDARRLIASGLSLDTTLAEVMSRQVVCVLPETSVDDALQLLADTDSRQLFAVAPDGTFLGIVAQRELAANA